MQYRPGDTASHALRSSRRQGTKVIENLMLPGRAYSDAYAARYEGHNAAHLDLQDARARFWRTMDRDDVINELDGDTLLKLVRAEDANALGRYVMSQMHAWADRLAVREVYGSEPEEDAIPVGEAVDSDFGAFVEAGQ